MNLKELTLENHKRAERSKFAGILIGGDIDPLLYYAYLCNQSHVYKALEEKLPLSLLGLEKIARSSLIEEDIVELERKYNFKRITVPALPSTISYQRYLNELQATNPRGVIAHLYVRHFGDMYGGSIIAKKTPGSGKMYEFENKDILKERVRKLLDDEMALEANRCFDFAIRLFEELEEWYARSKRNA